MPRYFIRREDGQIHRTEWTRASGNQIEVLEALGYEEVTREEFERHSGESETSDPDPPRPAA